MLEVVAARNTQKMISEVDYRKYLHQWICLPDMQVYVHARKVNEQLSDVSKCTGFTFYIQGFCFCFFFSVFLALSHIVAEWLIQ